MRLAASLVTVFWICLEVWAVGPTMRESDQASLLEGSVQLLVGDKDFRNNDSYNYEKQYLSYWVVAGWLKLREPAGDSSLSIVREGNLLAVTLFSLALLAAVGSQRRWSGVQVAVLYGSLFTPVLAFSGMFLSPNIISASFLLVLAVLLRPLPYEEGGVAARPSVGRAVLTGVLAWAATAARQDAVLLLPLLAMCTIREDSVRVLLQDRRVNAMIVGSVFAIILGFLLSDGFGAMPSPFLVLPTFMAFIGGGLGALLVLLLAFSLTMAGGRSPYRLLLAGVVLLPLIFYACVLYTPRHLFLPALAVLLTIFFDRGNEAWAAMARRRVGRFVIGLTLLGTILPWLVGARMETFRRGRPVTSAATLFPSTDGFWPMGAYGWFFSRLANGAAEPVDHNQRVFEAWSSVAAGDLPAGEGVILSSGLVSYGAFHLALLAKKQAPSLEEAQFVIFDERTLGKRQRGVNATEGSNRTRLRSLINEGQVREVGKAHGERILLWTPGRGAPEPGVSLKLALHTYYGGNDFRLRPLGEGDWKPTELQGHRGVVAGREREVLERIRETLLETGGAEKLESSYDPEPWWVLSVSAEKLVEFEEIDSGAPEDMWVAFSCLPEFMDVRSYAGGGDGK